MSANGQFTLSNLIATNIEVDTIGKTIIPLHSNVNLGSVDRPFKDVFVSSSTIHIGSNLELKADVDSDGNTFFAPNRAMKLKGSVETDDIIIDPNQGFKLGKTTIKKTGLEIENNNGETVVVDDTLFTTVDSRINTLAKNIAVDNSTKSDFGYLVDYKLELDGTSSNNITRVRNGNFELGKLFDKTDSLGLNTLIISEIPNDLPTFDNTGSVKLYNDNQKVNRVNLKLNDNAINTDLNTDDQYIIPIETNTNLHDIFPVNIFDMNKNAGRIKFKSDFDNTGSLYYSIDSEKISGLQSLKNYVQVSHPQFYAQNANQTDAFSLTPYETVVDFISYYQLPLLFENQKTVNDNNSKYEYYSSTDIENRLDNKVFQLEGNSSYPSENVYDKDIEIESTGIKLEPIPTNIYSVYPAIRVIKWKNTYSPTFTRLTNVDYTETFATALGWGWNNSKPTTSDVYAKYINSNTGENWIRKLVEITFAYLKYGQPLKLLNSIDNASINEILTDIENNKSLINIRCDSTDISITIKKDAFVGILYNN